jgi:hypothetical protein
MYTARKTDIGAQNILMLLMKCHCYDAKVGVWCAIGAQRKTGPMFLKKQ